MAIARLGGVCAYPGDVPWLDFGVPDPSFAIVSVAKIAHAHFSAELVRVSP